MVIMMAIIGEKLRLDRENALQIEGPLPEQGLDRRIAALGAINLRVRIDRANA